MPTYNIPFGELIGGPMTALIEGETLAAQASAEFIETLGFVKLPNASANDLGAIRTVTFNYQRENLYGQLETVSLEVPLLSLIPLPLLQIKHADFEFAIDITDVQNTTTKTTMSTQESNSAMNYFSGKRVKMLTNLKSLPTITTGTTATGAIYRDIKTNVQMLVKFHVEQADIPTGLAKIFQVFDAAVHQNQPTEHEKPTQVVVASKREISQPTPKSK